MASPPPSNASAAAGQMVAGRYELRRRVGKGGMAEVWSATDTELDRPVAIKWLRSNLAGDDVVIERFRREALAAAKLSHPNIVAIHDVCEHDGRQAVVMQLVDGRSLRSILDSQKRLGPELTIHIGAAIAGALDAAHRAGFVHRDVKPGNILVTSDGRVLLTDFGIAKTLQAGDEDLTSDNVMMGTAKYLSPEQVRGKPLDGRADLYSLGLVLYECLAGRVPFLGESDADTALARLQRDPTDLAHLRPTLPIGLVNLIHRTLARNPHHRPQSGADLRSALLAVDATPPDLDGTPADPPPRIANPPKQALGAGPGIPGQPHVSGVVPVTARDDRPTRSADGTSTPPQIIEIASVDDTPPGLGDLHGRPARQHEQGTHRPAVLLGVLVALALAMVAVLVIVNNRGEPADDLPSIDATATGTTDDDGSVGGAPPPTTASGPLSITEVRSYDPQGDNGSENDGQLSLIEADGDSNTFWATECYQNRYLGGKDGVGVVLTLSRPARGTVSFDVGHAPYQVRVYATTSLELPGDIGSWQAMGDVSYADTPGTVSQQVGLDATHVLVWLSELGPDDACSGSNPFRGLLGELSFQGA